MRICIFGAASSDIDPVYPARVRELGVALAKRGHSLMFGGGNHGLMGAAARGFTEGGGHIIGVAPRFFDRPGVLYPQCDAFEFTESMRDRKKYMEDHSDAFIVTPGGVGTYEEFFEVLTLRSLEQHGKPIVLYNVNGFFNDVVKLLEDGVAAGFIRADLGDLYAVTDDNDEVIRLLETGAADPGKAE